MSNSKLEEWKKKYSKQETKDEASALEQWKKKYSTERETVEKKPTSSNVSSKLEEIDQKYAENYPATTAPVKNRGFDFRENAAKVGVPSQMTDEQLERAISNINPNREQAEVNRKIAANSRSRGLSPAYTNEEKEQMLSEAEAKDAENKANIDYLKESYTKRYQDKVKNMTDEELNAEIEANGAINPFEYVFGSSGGERHISDTKTMTPKAEKYEREVIDVYEGLPDDVKNRVADISPFYDPLTKQAGISGKGESSISSHREHQKQVASSFANVKNELYSLGYNDDDIHELLLYSRILSNAESANKISEDLKKATTGELIAANLESIPANLTSGVGQADITAQTWRNRYTKNYRPVDYYTPLTERGRYAREVRKETSERIDNPVADFIYNTGMSIADSATSALVAGQYLAPIMLAGSAGLNTIYDAKERGLSDIQAVNLGLAASVNEALFEKISIDKFFEGLNNKEAKKFIVQIFTQAVPEGLEEVGTSLANQWADTIIAADKSQFNVDVSKYMQDGKTEEEAKSLAARDFFMSLGLDFLGGLFSGGVFGTVQAVANKVSSKGNTQAETPKIEATVNEEQVSDTSKKTAPTTVKEAETATGFGKYGAELVADIANSTGATLNEVSNAVKTAYMAGRTDLDISKASLETETQIKAFTAGKQDALMQNTAAKEEAKNATVYDWSVESLNNDERARFDKLSKEDQKQHVQVAKDLGLRLSFVERLVANVVDGEVYEANAQHEDGVYTRSETSQEKAHVDIVHEALHRMKQLAPEETQELINEIYRFTEEHGSAINVSMFEAVKAELENASVNENTTYVLEELGAKVIPTAFESAEAWNAWRKKLDSNSKLRRKWDKFISILKEIIEKAKRAIAQINMTAKEIEQSEAKARAMKELEHIKELYANAYRAARSVASEKSLQNNGEVKSAEAYNGTVRHSLKKGENANKESQYTDEQYRDYGWARENDVLNEGQNEDYRSKFADAKSGRAKFAKTKSGEFIIPVSDIYDETFEGVNNVLVFAKGTITNPVITSVIVIEEFEETILDRIRRRIYDCERRGIQQKTGRVFRRYYAFDFKLRPNQQGVSDKSVGYSGDNGHGGRSSEEAPSIKAQTKVNNSLKTAKITEALNDIGVQIDEGSSSVAPKKMFSLKTWNKSQYVEDKETAIKAIVKATGVSRDDANRYIDNINSIAKYIADNKERLDYEPNIDDMATVLKSNSEYKWTVDMSTLCAKRLLTTGTFDAIQKALPNTVFNSEDIVKLREMMMERGYEVACGICYVESTRRELGQITADFIERYKLSQETGEPMTRINSEGKVVELTKTKEQMKTTKDKSTNKFVADKNYTPTLAELNTTDIDYVKRDHPLVYEAYLNFMNARGQAKPKLLETRTEYKGEILEHFKNKKTVKSRNDAGGLRVQSFSDFEIAHLIDMMQIALDMSRVGLKSQAYTKVPAFAEVFGGTGMKINLSLIAKGTGLDENGNLIFDDIEGINHNEAFRLRKKYSKNVGTILVGKNDEHIIAALADPRIDFVIPFHKSSWKESLYGALGLEGYQDYTDSQHEKPIDKSRGKIANFMPSEYWDYTKSGKENEQIYLEWCKKDGRIPKFPQFVGKEGYWKLLIDFKMYDNDGVGSPQTVVKPEFDMDAAMQIMTEYEGGHRTLPVAQDVVDDFVKEYKSEKNFSLKDTKLTTSVIADILDAAISVESGDTKSIAKLEKYVESGLIPSEKYSELANKYGVIYKGEKPYRDVEVPKKTAKNKKVSQTVRTILESEATPDEALPTIEKMVEDGVFSYDVYTDKQAIADAEETVKRNGWTNTYTTWLKEVARGAVSKKNTVLGWALYNNAVNTAATTTDANAKKRAMSEALSILDAMVEHQRNAAQALQATRVLKKLSPETQLYGIKMSVKRLQEKLVNKYGKKAPELKIDEKLAEDFLAAETNEDRNLAAEEIYKDIGRQMPSDWLDKWNAWRYLAMLGNARTHVRNVVGNAGFAPVVAVKNLTATAIESFVYRVSGKKMLRGKALITGSKADKALLKAAWSDYNNVADIISEGGKYNDTISPNKYIEKGRRVFKTKFLEGARRGNSWLLDKEDMWFAQPHYAYALAQYCKANNITPEQIARGKAIDPARAYAVKEAQKATYRDANWFSQLVSGIGRGSKHKVIGALVEGGLPFRKTPANILVRGVEYSPIGLLKSISYDLVRLKSGDIAATELIDNISEGLTGTGLLLLGMFLARMGLIRGHGEDDEKEKKFKEMMGHQSYSLEVGGQSFTLDWLAPEALPFFVGVNIWEQTGKKNEEVNLSTILQAVSGISEPLKEMSFLQGINDILESISYASSNDTDQLTAIIASAATSYLSQGMPTLLGQFERTGEANRMTTYTEKNDFLTGDMQYTLGKLSAKIPFIDYQQIPYIDAWGRKEASGTALKRGLNNFLNPAYTSNIEESKMEKELLRLFEQTGEASVFPQRADKYFTVDGERKDLTAEEYVKYATLKGEKSYKLVTDLVKSEAYKKLSDTDKVKAIEEAYDLANQKAKQAVSNYKPEKWVTTADAFGDNAGNYLAFKSDVSTTRKENGNKISKSEIVDIISDYSQSDDETWAMYLSMYDSKNDLEAKKYDIDVDRYLEAIVMMDSIKPDYKKNGDVISGSRRKKVERYLKTICKTYEEYYFLLGTQFDSVKDDAPYIKYVK